MKHLITLLILALFMFLAFFRELFPNDLIYWFAYVVMTGLVFVLWVVMFWVSKKKNNAFLGKEPVYDTFVGRVSKNVNDDLMRGRLSVIDDKLVLVQRKNSKLEKTWELPVSEITEITFGKVAGVRKGFTLITENDYFAFVCSKMNKEKEIFFKALGWN